MGLRLRRLFGRAYSLSATFGMLSNFVCNGEVERFGLGGCRYQAKGRREVTLLNYTAVSKYFPIQDLSDQLQCSSLDSITRLLAGASTEMLDDFLKVTMIFGGEVFSPITIMEAVFVNHFRCT